MAMNDISTVIRSEKDTYLAIKDNGLSESSESTGVEFLSQLYNAHNSSEPKTKELDSSTHKESEKSDTSDGKKTDNDSLLSGDNMLAQINSAQAIDTSIKKHVGESTQPISTGLNKANIVTNDAELDVLAQGDSKVVTEQSESAKTDSTKTTAIESLLNKDASLIKSDKTLASLTPEQREQLNTQIQAMDKPQSNDNVTALKQMLAQYITENEQSSTAVSKQSVSSEVDALTTTEKQALLSQLNSYMKNAEPKGEQLISLKETISDLKTSIDKSITINEVQKQDSKLDGNESNKLMSNLSKDEGLEKQFDTLQKESARSNSADQPTNKVTKLLAQITGGFSTSQANTLSDNNILSYEESVIDMQALQSQALQSTAQVKQVSIDPGVMQAINIIKSDAAKLLQERVSSMLSINNKEAEIRLDPPEMGSMQIRIRSDAEQAQINFVVQNQQAKEALEQSLPRLREMLAQQGIDLGESTISYGGSGSEGAEHNESDSKSTLANKNSVIDENDDTTGSGQQSSRQQTSSSIDYYA